MWVENMDLIVLEEETATSGGVTVDEEIEFALSVWVKFDCVWVRRMVGDFSDLRVWLLWILVCFLISVRCGFYLSNVDKRDWERFCVDVREFLFGVFVVMDVVMCVYLLWYILCGLFRYDYDSDGVDVDDVIRRLWWFYVFVARVDFLLDVDIEVLIWLVMKGVVWGRLLILFEDDELLLYLNLVIVIGGGYFK